MHVQARSSLGSASVGLVLGTSKPPCVQPRGCQAAVWPIAVPLVSFPAGHTLSKPALASGPQWQTSRTIALHGKGSGVCAVSLWVDSGMPAMATKSSFGGRRNRNSGLCDAGRLTMAADAAGGSDASCNVSGSPPVNHTAKGCCHCRCWASKGCFEAHLDCRQVPFDGCVSF